MNLSRRQFLNTVGTITTAHLLSASLFSGCGKAKRPNILWIISEDTSPDLGCYGNKIVKTPNLDKLADEGIRYTNAFATCPVCSPTRSALMTGMYQTSIDAQNHRSHRNDGYTLPKPVEIVTEYFRRSGYFTANVTTVTENIQGSGKTDFNFSVQKPFDGIDWNQRNKNQPFFAQVNLRETHRPFATTCKNPTDPDQVEIPPYSPDHPLFRKMWAEYYDAISVLDEEVGGIIKRLENENLLENTIIFYFGDHGRPMVRGKQWLYESGIHIPLLVRMPGKEDGGQVSDELISSIDITATSLKLAGITPPQHMEGQVFLGKSKQKRNYIISARDRCDETVDRIRCVRTKQYKYIRNYYPEKPYLQLNRYKEARYPEMRLLRKLFVDNKLNEVQSKFMQLYRPIEEFYDLEVDPFEINNLALQDEYTVQVNKMRNILESWIDKTGDKGQYPENQEIYDYWINRQKKKWDVIIQKNH